MAGFPQSPGGPFGGGSSSPFGGSNIPSPFGGGSSNPFGGQDSPSPFGSPSPSPFGGGSSSPFGGSLNPFGSPDGDDDTDEAVGSLGSGRGSHSSQPIQFDGGLDDDEDEDIDPEQDAARRSPKFYAIVMLFALLVLVVLVYLAGLVSKMANEPDPKPSTSQSQKVQSQPTQSPVQSPIQSPVQSPVRTMGQGIPSSTQPNSPSSIPATNGSSSSSAKPSSAPTQTSEWVNINNLNLSAPSTTSGVIESKKILKKGSQYLFLITVSFADGSSSMALPLDSWKEFSSGTPVQVTYTKDEKGVLVIQKVAKK